MQLDIKTSSLCNIARFKCLQHNLRGTESVISLIVVILSICVYVAVGDHDHGRLCRSTSNRGQAIPIMHEHRIDDLLRLWYQVVGRASRQAAVGDNLWRGQLDLPVNMQTTALDGNWCQTQIG